jgi:formylglycine-generating enzyme required for sulfatase activity
LPAEKAAGRVYRLPTEAEWEYACRAGTTTTYHLGDSLSSAQANFNGNLPSEGAEKGPFLARTTVVGSYKPNALGLFDMHGNVCEWCADPYNETYYQKSPPEDPTGVSGHGMVYRGGSWGDDASGCRSACRETSIKPYRYRTRGFRVVLSR